MQDKASLRCFEEEYFSQVYDHGRREIERQKILQANFRLLQQRKQNLKRILDVGCAFGDFLGLCQTRGIEAFGIEKSKFALNKARSKIGKNVFQLDAAKNSWPFKDNFFDAVTIFDVLEHTKDPENMISESCRVLSNGGIAFITTPNDQGKMGRFLERWMPDDPTHVNKKESSKWRKILEESGFRDIETLGVLVHGLPPGPRLRDIAEKMGFPTIIQPIFFPIKFLCGTLFIFARK